jgi:hypothetical protein
MNMFKKSIQLPLIYFLVSTFYQFIKNGEIRWMENVAVFFFIFLFVWFSNWADVPYKWRKDHMK